MLFPVINISVSIHSYPSHANLSAEPGATSFISLFKESLIGILFLSYAMPLYGSDLNISISHYFEVQGLSETYILQENSNKGEGKSEVERN